MSFLADSLLESGEGDCLLEGIQCAPSQFSFRTFTWLFVVYILKEKLAQNHSMTSLKFCEFGFPLICIYSK